MKPLSSPAHHRGVAAIEFALVLMPMLLICFGITELGRAFYYYDTLTKSTRAAVRHLTTLPQGDTSARAEAQCLAVYGTTDCSGTVLAPGLTTGMVDICDAMNCSATHRNVATGSGVVDLVTVTIGTVNTPYQFNSLVLWVIPNITFGPIHATMTQLTS